MSATVTGDWLNLSDAAALLGVHPSTLRAWSDRGDIPTHRTPGKHRRFRRADIESWLDSRRESQVSPGQLIVENALGRTRMQMAEGRLSETDWYQRFDEPRRRELREMGRSQLRLLLRYLGDEADGVLPEMQTVGGAHRRPGPEARVSLSATVRAFLHFPQFPCCSALHVSH